MAVTVAGTSHTSPLTTSTSTTVAMPSGATAADTILVSWFMAPVSGSPPSASTPSGWTLVNSATWGTGWRHCVWVAPYASLGNTITWGGTSAYAGYIAVAVSGGVFPVNASSTSGTGAPFGTTIAVPGVTTTATNCELFVFVCTDSSRTYTPPADFTELVDTGDGLWAACSISPQASAGSSGTKTATASSAAGLEGIMVAVAPATVMAAPTIGTPSVVHSHATASIAVSVTTNGSNTTVYAEYGFIDFNYRTPRVSLAHSASPQAVTLALAPLRPSTLYRSRVVAENGPGTTTSA